MKNKTPGYQYIELSKNLEIIDDLCFYWCEKLRALSGNVRLLKKIGFRAFENCSSLEIIGELENVEYIGTDAFSACSSLQTIYITSEKLSEIGSSTFAGCTNLSYVRLPYNLASIDETAFDDCPNLLFYCYVNSYAHKYADEHGIMYTLMPLMLYGDINQDYRITAADALKSLRIPVGSETAGEYEAFVGDVNGDEKITASDALIILRYSVGADTTAKVGTPI